MIRVVIENIAIFLIPTLVYAAYVLLTMQPATEEAGDRAFARIVGEAPLLWLFTAGAILVVLSLIAFQSTDGGRPGMKYQAPSMQGGHIQPSHAEPASPK
jgi:hypothetical protein